MKKYTAALLFALLSALPALHAQQHRFGFAQQQFLLDGQPFRIISGEMHPARIPREYWRHRIQMAKAMGCNTIAVYIFWNYHELQEGLFDFSTGNRNISEFIKICREEKLWVILRPGPYVCAEWDFGGLPSYLLKIPDIKLRCMDPRYMKAVERYINRFAQVVKPHMVSNGGNILMVQVENEYGSYGNDKQYLEAIKNLWVKNGIKGPFYTSDGPTPYMLDAGTITGGAIGLDSGDSPDAFATAHKFNPNVPVFSGETYPGWLTHWGENWARPDTTSLKKEISFLLKENHSFNFYVIHGGTNFGFAAGANAFSSTQYQPDLTSYDYDAPIDEQGRPTPKYFLLRNLIQQYTNYPLPPVPAPIPTITIPDISLQPVSSIWSHLPKPIQSAQPLPLEAFSQNQGLALYTTKLIGHKSGTLTIWEPHDYALVFLNGKFIDTIYRDGGHWSVKLPASDVKDPELEILVEGMGHINFAQFMIDRKGITDRVTLNGMTLMNWKNYPLPMDSRYVQSAAATKTDFQPGKEGNFFKGSFALNELGDTFLDLRNFKKGMVYVNGHNLGRYWYIGPQQRLYCPATYLKKGRNEIIVFDFWQQEGATIAGKTTMD